MQSERGAMAKKRAPWAGKSPKEKPKPAREGRLHAARAPRQPAPAKPGVLSAQEQSLLDKSSSAIAAYHEEILRQNEELLEAQNALEQSRDRYARLYDEAPVGYMTLDHNGVIEEVNLTSLILLGSTRDSVMRRPLLVFIHEVVRTNCLNFMLSCRATVGPQKRWTELRLRGASGTYTHVQLSAVGVRRPVGRGLVFLTALTDISGRVQMEAERRGTEARIAEEKRQRLAAQAANEAKDRFLAMLSHELRTPLTPALMRLSAIVESGDLAGEYRSELQIVRDDIELEAHLIDDLLDLNRILRGKFEPHLEVLDLREVIRRSLQVCEPIIQGSRMNVVENLPDRALPVCGDAVRLQQVFWNIVRNAVKFTPAGGRIAIDALGRGGEVTVRVTDTGMGIEREVLPRIYNVFEQGSSEVQRRYGGLGLGLAISKAIVEAHHGRIEAESAGRDRGTTFAVTLPLEAAMPVREARGGKLPPRAEQGGEEQRRLRILLVEDHPPTRSAMTKLLTATGYDIHAAATAREAVEAAAHEKFDLVVSDLGLPDRTGYDLMVELHREHGLKGIAVSGFGMEQDQGRSREAGFSAHLTKPITIQTLRAAINKVAAESPEEQPVGAEA